MGVCLSEVTLPGVQRAENLSAPLQEKPETLSTRRFLHIYCDIYTLPGDLSGWPTVVPCLALSCLLIVYISVVYISAPPVYIPAVLGYITGDQQETVKINHREKHGH